MEISAKIIADSLPYWGDPATGKKHRITTMELTYPRFIHSEFMTHRKFSRNAASSRAIPVKKMLKQVWSDPATPVWWGKNQPGMQANEELSGWRLKAAKRLWVLAGCMMVVVAGAFEKIGLHKQVANRILEPWMWMKTIVTATEFNHFFRLRRAKEAQPEIKVLADCMWNALNHSVPRQLQTGQWHLPYVTIADYEWAFNNLKHEEWIEPCGYQRQKGAVGKIFEMCGPHPSDPFFRKLSASRCARVSYLNHDGTKPDPNKDLELFERLVAAPHASPFEHQATPFHGSHANFDGWRQFRAEIPNEYLPE